MLHKPDSDPNPSQFAQLVEQAIPQSAPEEARRLADHAKAFAWKTYDGHEPVYLGVLIAKLDLAAERKNQEANLGLR